MRAKDVMSSPVITITKQTSVKDAAEMLVRHQISALPVVDEADKLVGIVSEADLLPLELTPDPRAQITPAPVRTVPRTVADVMTEEVVALPEHADVAWAAELMLEKRVKRIPIVSGERVVGIVSRRDLLKILARSDEDIRRELQAVLNQEAKGLGAFRADVSGGVITLTGPSDRLSRRAAALLARSVAGVLEVRLDDVVRDLSDQMSAVRH